MAKQAERLENDRRREKSKRGKGGVFLEMGACVFLLVLLLGCGGESEPEAPLTDAGFAALFEEVYELSERYARMPDSLAVHREAAFLRHGVTREDVREFIARRREDPQLWDPVLDRLRERLKDPVPREGITPDARSIEGDTIR